LQNARYWGLAPPIYNLTKDESPALIHIGKDKTQQWTLVRLKQPEQAGSEE
jgi:hypothetical protein